MTTHTKKRIVRSLLALAGAIVVFVGVVGFAHTKKGRFLLAYIPGMGACPVGKPATAEQIEVARAKGREAIRGTVAAKVRPALGFDLDRTTKADLLAWAAKNAVACTDDVKKLAVTCRDVPASALEGATAPVDQLYVSVNQEGRLKSVEAMRRAMSFDAAVELVDQRSAAVAEAAGGTTDRTGVTRGDELASGALRVAQAELRYTNYRFVVTARNQGGANPVVRERYQSIDDTKM